MATVDPHDVLDEDFDKALDDCFGDDVPEPLRR